MASAQQACRDALQQLENLLNGETEGTLAVLIRVSDQEYIPLYLTSKPEIWKWHALGAVMQVATDHWVPILIGHSDDYEPAENMEELMGSGEAQAKGAIDVINNTTGG